MHPISDKELDKLFKQRFEEAEIEPSEALWGKINDTMYPKKRANSFPLFWMAAASVILVLSAGLWFYRPGEVIKLQGTTRVAVKDTNEQIHLEAAGQKISIPSSPAERAEIKISKSVKAVPEDFNLPENQPAVEINKAVIAGQPLNSTASNTPVRKIVPQDSQQNREVKIPARYSGDQSKLDVTQPDMIARAEAPVTDKFTEEPVREHKKIRSIGSLVNFVIAKVDKREDKIIEFNDGEEGSAISGINLGLIKLTTKE